VEDVFEILDTPGLYEDASVAVSYLQIYNNQVHDLQGEFRHIHERLNIKRAKGKDKHANTIKGMIETPVTCVEQAISIVREGNKHRVTKAHKMNEMSSRSHAVFVLKLQLKNLMNLRYILSSI